MIGKTRYNFWFDLAIFAAFFITAVTGIMLWLIIPGGQSSGDLTLWGLTRSAWIDVHNWAGVTMLAGILLHLVLHWKWINCVAGRYFKKLARQARLNFSLDGLLFIAFFLASLSGLVAWLIVPGGGYRGGRNPYYNATLFGLTHHSWNNLHLWTGLAMMAIVIVHLALHWPWIVCVARRYAQTTLCNQQECAAT